MSAAPAPTPPAPQAQPYDFRQPRLLSHELLRTLHTVHEAFGRRLAVYLSVQLRMLVEVSTRAVEQKTYADFVASSASPSALFIGEAKAIEQRFLLEVDPRLALFVAERLFGGTGTLADEARPLSQIEQRVAHRLAAHGFADLGTSWGDVAPLALRQVGYEQEAPFVQLLPDDAPVVIVTFEACVREQCAPLRLCYPFSFVHQVMNAPGAGRQVSEPPDETPGPVRERYEEAVGSTAVALTAELGRTRLPLGDLLHLAVGDVIPLRRRPTEALPVYVGEHQRFRATAGRSGSRCALRIVEALAPPPEPLLFYDDDES